MFNLPNEVRSHNKPTCSTCQQVFSSLNHLTRHENIHIKTKQRFSCDVCGNTFGRKDSLGIHKKTHKGDDQTTTLSTATLKLNQYPSQPLISIKKMFLVDSDQWESSKLNNAVPSSPQRGLLPGPVESLVSPLDEPSSIKKMLLVDPVMWESSKLNNDVTSTSQRGLLPGPIESSVSALGQTPSDKDLVLFEPDPEDSSRSNSVVTSIPQRTQLSGSIAPSIFSSESSLQNLGQPLSQTYVHTLNNNSTHNVFTVIHNLKYIRKLVNLVMTHLTPAIVTKL